MSSFTFVNLSSLSLLSDWNFVCLHPGLILVLIGVAGEGVELVVKWFWKRRSKNCDLVLEGVELFFWAMVVVGLALEMSDAAKTDNEVIALNQKIEQINPLNEPIRSMRAVVYLLVRGDFSNDPIFFPNRMIVKDAANIPIQGALPTEGADFSIDGDGGSWLILDCDKIDSFLTGVEKPGESKMSLPNARRFEMVFIWPGPVMTSQETSPDFRRFWIDRKDISTSELDKAAVRASLTFFGFHKGMEVVNGSCDITINGKIPRHFSNPKLLNDVEVVFSPMENPAP